MDDIVSEIDSLRNLHSPGLFEEDRLEKIATSLTQNQKEVFSVLNKEPLHIDEIIRLTGRESSNLLSILLSLELNDYIAQLPGKHFQVK